MKGASGPELAVVSFSGLTSRDCPNGVALPEWNILFGMRKFVAFRFLCIPVLDAHE